MAILLHFIRFDVAIKNQHSIVYCIRTEFTVAPSQSMGQNGNLAPFFGRAFHRQIGDNLVTRWKNCGKIHSKNGFAVDDAPYSGGNSMAFESKN
jgi:hypothetical protein